MLKSSYQSIKKYSFLLQQLVSRDFKVKYKRSVLGILWSLLYPILMMTVMAIVFSNVFKFSVPGVNYLVYLLTGLTLPQKGSKVKDIMIKLYNIFAIILQRMSVYRGLTRHRAKLTCSIRRQLLKQGCTGYSRNR